MDPEWLKAELMKPGRSQAALARFLGLDTSAVNRICAGTRQVKANEADRIRAYLAATTSGGVPSQENHIDVVAVAGIIMLPVRGTVEAGAWREPGASPPGPRSIPVIAQSIFEGDDVFALRVVGPSMDLFYKDGSYVIVRRWGGGPLPYGKHVVVERERQDGLREYTVKELRPGPEQPELWPRSSDPSHQSPIRYGTGADRTVSIVGRVVAAFTFTD